MANATQLLLAPVGAGKTEASIDRLIDVTRTRPFARAWVLLAGERQIYHFRKRMAERNPQRRVYFNIEYFSFYRLYKYLLDAAGKPQRCLEEGARFRLMREIVADLVDELEVYGTIAHTPGFIRIVGEFIYELKQNLIVAEDFAQTAHTAKDRDLARIYVAYQEKLRDHNLVDREGEGWLALSFLREQPRLGSDVDLLIVDGYDQFTVLQARIIALLAGRAADSLVTLTKVPGRERTIGRRFHRAHQRLQTVHDELNQALVTIDTRYTDQDRHETLETLVNEVFLPRAKATAAEGVIRLIEAPDPLQEVGAVLREVKRLLLDGVSPSDILIALRGWEQYAGYFDSTAQEYGLNTLLAMQYGESLAHNPAIRALLDLLDLPLSDYRRRNLLDVLRSPYFKIPGLDGEWVDHLERISRALRIMGGRTAWLDAVLIAVNTPVDPEDQDGEFLLTPEASERLHKSLSSFFDVLAQPETAKISFYVNWLETLIGQDPEQENDDPDDFAPAHAYTLGMIAQIRMARRPLADRDLTALERLKMLLRAFVSTQDLFQALGSDDSVAWTVFLTDLKATIASTSVERAPAREGRMLVTTVTDARGLPHPHVFILGLSEGVFPARVPEDPLYLDSERQRFNQAGIALPTLAERSDDDGLFYELISLARRSLTLSRPYIQNGEPWPESHLWRAVQKLFDLTPTRLPIGGVVAAEHTASLQEAAISVARGLNTDVPSEGTAAVYNWLLRGDETLYWQQVWMGRTIEASRLSAYHPYDRYTGRLEHAEMIAEAAHEIHPRKVWSATQLNDYGICSFRFFAKRMLRLETLEEPESGMNTLQAGTINHEILDATYRRIEEQGLEITTENSNAAVQILREAAREVLNNAPEKHGFQESALWAQEQRTILRKLEALIRKDFSDESPLNELGSSRMPYKLEAEFDFQLDIERGLVPLHIRGKIDRVDRAGDRLMVVDYKTGSTKIDTKELARGRNFQMMIYALAAKAMFSTALDPVEVVGGMFWHIGSGKPIGSLMLDEEEDRLAIYKSFDHLERYIRRGRQGDFASHANKPEEGRCARFCEFHTLCRAGTVSRRKPQD